MSQASGSGPSEDRPLPPKPPARAERVSLRTYARLFKADILSAQPARLYRAWMAEFKTPFFRSFMINQPDLVKKSGGATDVEVMKLIRESKNSFRPK